MCVCVSVSKHLYEVCDAFSGDVSSSLLFSCSDSEVESSIPPSYHS